ncbi:hypothetical protein BD311DRAFT_701753 [Dichomitus squalens]|uniref:AB hydrolase-1 domain-containing protein n=1 Tax=Dichomitus squalens TaxID=114155 RepID=A0A4Q9MFE1_9APHY|nr:hypothetical protein BD311DRAFT_701753 [Dichomitus squalens]
MTERTLRLGILQDSGAPEGSTDYTTIVLLHGLLWHSTVFAKLVPIAGRFNARVILVNRQDYPGAEPFTLEERAELSKAVEELKKNPLSARDRLDAHMKRQAREIYDLLIHLVAEHHIPPANFEANTGGIIIGGWSFGAAWMTALLANAASFPVRDIKLGRYMRRVIIYDTADFVIGFQTLPDAYFPLNDGTLPAEQYAQLMAKWITAYFPHGDSPEQYEYKTYLTSPPPTFTVMTEEERQSTKHDAPGDSKSGSDYLLMIAARQSGLFDTLRKNALRLPPPNASLVGDAWKDVEVRNLLCDRSLWFILWADANLRREVADERKAGIPLRPVTFTRVRGANHFVHWDEPERAMHAILDAVPAGSDDLEV